MTEPLVLRIIMAWPSRALSPNARVHWSKRAKAAKPYRLLGFSKALAARAAHQLEPLGSAQPVEVVVTFLPPDRRGRDDDNMIGAFKSGRDGIADGLGVNDKMFRCTYRVGEPVKGGRVVVDVATAPAGASLSDKTGPEGSKGPPEWLRPSTGKKKAATRAA